MGASRSAYLVCRLLPNRITQIRMPSQSKNVSSGRSSVQLSHLNHRPHPTPSTVPAGGLLGIQLQSLKVWNLTYLGQIPCFATSSDHELLFSANGNLGVVQSDGCYLSSQRSPRPEPSRPTRYIRTLEKPFHNFQRHIFHKHNASFSTNWAPPPTFRARRSSWILFRSSSSATAEPRWNPSSSSLGRFTCPRDWSNCCGRERQKTRKKDWKSFPTVEESEADTWDYNGCVYLPITIINFLPPAWLLRVASNRGY